MKPVLFLDVMDTIVHDPFRGLPAFFDMSLPELLRQKHPSAWVEFERGECTESEFLANFFSDRRVYDHKGMLALMREGYRWLDGMEPLLQDLAAQGVPMHTLSNYPVWWKMIEEKLNLSRYVSWTFVSCDHGVRKPQPQAYECAARAASVNIKHGVFVDDRASNCEGARVAGMQAIHFENAAQLRQELQRLEIL
ncbi:MAG: HAD family phosphatase [bacterium]